MTNPLLIIDANYLCHRAYHALGDLTYGGAGTGAVLGVLRDIVGLQDMFATDRCVFAFDYGAELRRHQILPTYKSTRRARYDAEDDAAKEARKDFHRQVRYLRSQYLPAAGFRNVFATEGFEADDIIASVAARVAGGDEAVIVGSDHDLWQCLRPNVWVWNPQKRSGYSYAQFVAEWGIEPDRWPHVKALAGCATDDVPGVPGVGERTAAKWLRGELGGHTKAAAKLRAAGEVLERNLPVVTLPYPGTPRFEIRRDEVTQEKWQALAESLGLRSIMGKAPRSAGRKSRGRKRNGKGFGINGSG